jgi:hypothetical protein
MPRSRDWYLQEVQTNHSAPARRHGKQERRPAGRPCSPLTRLQVGQVLIKIWTSAARDGCRIEALSQRQCFIPPEVIAKGGNMELSKGESSKSRHLGCTEPITTGETSEEQAIACEEGTTVVLSAVTWRLALSTILPRSWYCRSMGPRICAVGAATESEKSARRNHASSAGDSFYVKMQNRTVDSARNLSDDLSSQPAVGAGPSLVAKRNRDRCSAMFSRPGIRTQSRIGTPKKC